MDNNKELPSTEYKYGFHDKDVSVFKTGKGLNEETVREISRIKKEPEWMLDLRLKATMNGFILRFRCNKMYGISHFAGDLRQMQGT